MREDFRRKGDTVARVCSTASRKRSCSRKYGARSVSIASKFLTSGSAPLHIDTAMTFLGIGIPIMQGYGLTETSPVTSVSRLSENEYGAVGRPIPGVEVRIARGWRGPRSRTQRHAGLLSRSRKRPQRRSSDGWLHTGDIGEIDAAGFLRITDRKGEIFKTDTGKWISPARDRGEYQTLDLRVAARWSSATDARIRSR